MKLNWFILDIRTVGMMETWKHGKRAWKQAKEECWRDPHLFGSGRFDLLHLVGLHLGLHLLPVLPYGALLGPQPGGLLGGLSAGWDLAHSLLGRWLHSLNCR